MDRTMGQQHLAQAERHVAQGDVIVARQRELVSRLERAGLDTKAASLLLRQFEISQALHVAHRNRRRKELG